MSTENNKDWILCRSYRFPNKFYYFNVHNGESKWAKTPTEKKPLLNSNKSGDLCITPKIKLNSNNSTEPNKSEEVASLIGEVLCRPHQSDSNKSYKQDNRQSQTFATNIKPLPASHSEFHTPTSFTTNRHMFVQLLKKRKRKTLVKTQGSINPPFFNNEGNYTLNSLNDTKVGEKSFKIHDEPKYTREQKITWDPYLTFHSSQDSQNEDFSTDLTLSSITNKMENINIQGCSSNVLTDGTECDNFIAQHNQKWFVFRSGSQNEDRSTANGFDDTRIKFKPFGRNMQSMTGVKKTMTKHETKDTCFIVVDLNVLLNDFQFINNIVLQDKKYRLVIPYAVLSKLRALAEMDHKSRQLMITAQNLIWKISNQSQHIIMEPVQPITSPTSQQIISCCKKIKNLHYSLILLTNDADLYASAIGHNLVSYILQEVKEGQSGPLFNTDVKNLQNDERKDVNNNLFLQKPSKIQPFNFSNLTSKYVNHSESIIEGQVIIESVSADAKLKDNYVNEKLKRFCLKNRQMAGLIVLRAEDYMCTFTQIMETFMSDLLLNENVNYDFCTIPQAVDGIAQLYPDHRSVQIAAYRMSALYNLINQNGKVETESKADILIKMVGCGIILVESIKAVKPNSEILLETEYLLIKLHKSIENPEQIENELDPAKTVKAYNNKDVSETSFEGHQNRLGEDTDYLNGNFTELNENEELIKQTNSVNNRIIRTTGRDLNSLRICNNGVMLDINENYESKNDKKFSEKSNIDIKINMNIDKEDISKRVFDSIVHENAFTSDLETNIGPKVIRSFGAIKAFENRIGNKLLDKEIDNIISDTKSTREETNSNENNKKDIHGEDLDKISETYTDVAYQTEVYNSDIVNDKCGTDPLTLSASNDDSGLGNEYCNAYLVFKKFIFDMRSTLNIVYGFIKDTSLVLRGKNIKEENRREIFDKAYKTYNRMSLVVDNLTNIIKRENEEDKTVASLLERAGIDVASDKRISGYKRIVTTYLEQVDLLQQALKIIYIATNSTLPTPQVEVTDVCY